MRALVTVANSPSQSALPAPIRRIDVQGWLKVERVDGKIFLFDVSTGKTTEA